MPRPARRELRPAKLAAAFLAGPRNQLQEIGFGAGIRERRERHAADGVLQPQVEPDPAGPRDGEIGSEHDQVGAEVLVNLRERILGVALRVGQFQFHFHPRDIFAGNRSQSLRRRHSVVNISANALSRRFGPY